MSAVDLAVQLVALLSPVLPFILKAGEKATETIGEQIGSELWLRVQNVWSVLHPKIESNPAASEAARDVAGAPNNQRARDALAWQLEKILKDDSKLAQHVAELLGVADTPSSTRIVTASGAGSVAGGGDISNSTIVTGTTGDIGSPGKADDKG